MLWHSTLADETMNADECLISLQRTNISVLKSNWLVVLTILKNMKVNGKDDIPYIMENKKCSKPSTR